MQPEKRDDARDDELIARAREAAQRAFAPYSRYRVGAAVRDADGVIFSGCNVESPTYALSMCAERLAIFSALAGGGRRPIVSLAVACPDAAPGFGAAGRMPCGMCRQLMTEQLAPGAVIWVDGEGRFSLEQLLPMSFALERARREAALEE